MSRAVIRTYAGIDADVIIAFVHARRAATTGFRR
jgi:hypothetical protein